MKCPACGNWYEGINHHVTARRNFEVWLRNARHESGMTFNEKEEGRHIHIGYISKKSPKKEIKIDTSFDKERARKKFLNYHPSLNRV